MENSQGLLYNLFIDSVRSLKNLYSCFFHLLKNQWPQIQSLTGDKN